MLRAMTVLGFAFVTAAATAAEYDVVQENKSFSRSTLNVKVGDTVHFPNQDTTHHNVFSLSEAATFDLGSYGNGESKSYTFEEPGEVEVECAIHPGMRMTVVVE